MCLSLNDIKRREIVKMYYLYVLTGWQVLL